MLPCWANKGLEDTIGPFAFDPRERDAVNPKAKRWLAGAEVAAMTALVPAFIWDLQFRWPNSWIVFPAWLALSFLIHRDTPKALGWRADNLWAATRPAAVFFVLFAAALLLFAVVLGTIQTPPLHLFSPRRIGLYLAFCLLQQVALQSFLNNRLLVVCSHRIVSSLLAGAIFAAAHWPNPVLVPVTLIGGSVLAALFARERNILPLVIGQALIGSLLWICFPVEWHHRMRVGPRYFRPF